ncbi:MAG: hybrid sensor histidine kinase/response regulator [Campylobacterales bacterium]|nr:hybrid sensor histidine kinase/response regulator [Campylobacterales bacterium]
MNHTTHEKTKISILIVEDSLTQAEEVRFFLESYDYTVAVCRDGIEALEWLQNTEKNPDVIVSDVIMPRMDGYDFCKAVRADEKFKDIPVILLTSLSQPHDIIKSIEAGANKFLTKPFDHKRLPEVIDELYINTQRRSVERMEMGIRLIFGGNDFLITADKVQILDLLLSSYEDSYYKNLQLQETRSELEKLNAALEEKVQERTKELREKEKIMMIQSRQAAMGDMIAMIAHQWRQPLAIVSMDINNLKLSIALEEEISTALLEKHIESITEQVQQLSQTIDDFRNFFNPNQVKETITIADVLEKTLRIIQKSMVNHNITIVVENSSETKLETYSNQLLQVFLNIINNAKDVLITKSVPNAQVLIKIEDTEDSVVTKICDNGGGIPKDIIEQIGAPYFTTKKTEGTGLGLYMSKIIMTEHLNGKLTWENKEKGICFTILLPKNSISSVSKK